jgi:hypothetical protein
MRSLSPITLLLVFVGCQFQASCGGKTLNMKNAREFISSTLERQVGEKPTDVTCPHKVAIETGKTFECTATFGKPVANVLIVQNDDKGNVTMQSITGILIASKLENAIAEDFGNKLNAKITAACGDRVRAATPGETFTCDVTDAKGASAKAEVLVKDTTGQVTFRLVTSAAPPAPPATP